MKGALKFIAGVVAGTLYGMLFAQRSGKQLRSALKRSKHPVKLLFEEGRKMDKEAWETLKKWAEESEELQKLYDMGQQYFETLTEQAKTLGADAQKELAARLEALISDAKSALGKLKTEAKERVKKGPKNLLKGTTIAKE